MSNFPGGITLRTVTYTGVGLPGVGDEQIIEIDVLPLTPLIWKANRWQMPARGWSVRGLDTAHLAIPVTDQIGYQMPSGENAGSPSTQYWIRVRVHYGANLVNEVSKIVPLPTGDGSPVDLDTMLPVGTVAGGAVLVPDTWDARVAAAEALTTSITVAPDPAVPAAPRAATYLGDAYSIADAASYTLAVPFGAPSTARTIVAVVTARRSPPGAAITSATIGGVPAVVDAETSTDAAGTSAAIIRATVPTGTTGDIVVNLNGTAIRCHVAAWAIDGAVSKAASGAAYTGTGGAVTTPTRINLAVLADDIVISGTHGSASSAKTNWSGVTKRYDFTLTEGSIMTVSGGHRQMDVPGTQAVTRTPVTAIGYVAHVAAAYRAA